MGRIATALAGIGVFTLLACGGSEFSSDAGSGGTGANGAGASSGSSVGGSSAGGSAAGGNSSGATGGRLSGGAGGVGGGGKGGSGAMSQGGASGGNGGSVNMGGTGGSPPPACPDSRPSVGDSCPMNGKTCSYQECCNETFTCEGGQWASDGCPSAPCPTGPPAEGTSCSCATNCLYPSCYTENTELIAHCVGGNWELTQQSCGWQPCEGTYCDEDSVCTEYDPLVGEATRSCQGHTCTSGDIDCSCAGNACGIAYGCEGVVEGVLRCSQTGAGGT